MPEHVILSHPGREKLILQISKRPTCQKSIKQRSRDPPDQTHPRPSEEHVSTPIYLETSARLNNADYLEPARNEQTKKGETCFKPSFC